MSDPAQNNLFDTMAPPAESDLLLGLEVKLSDKCPSCERAVALIGPGSGPHKAALRCGCGKHRGWVSSTSFAFLQKIVETFGRPTTPIAISRGSARAQIAKQDEYLKRKFTPEGVSWYDIITEASGFAPPSNEIAPAPIDAGQGNDFPRVEKENENGSD
jgi:hypothetical protein